MPGRCGVLGGGALESAREGAWEGARESALRPPS